MRIKHFLFLAALWALTLTRFGQSLWLDETSSVWFARFPWIDLLSGLCDPHPPVYYLLLKGWVLLGDQEFWLRFPSLFAAMLAVTLTYRLGAQGGDDRRGWLAGMLLALYPLQSWYASEVRMYTLVQALGLATVWLGMRLFQLGDPVPAPGTRRPRQGSGESPAPVARSGAQPATEFVAYWLVATIALWVDFSALFPFALLQLLWVARGCPQPRRWLGIQAAVLFPTALVWSAMPQARAMRDAYQPVFLAIQASSFGLELTPAAAASLLQAGAIGVGLSGLALAWAWPRGLDRRFQHPFFIWLVVVGWALLIGLSVLPRLFTVKRHLIVVAPYLVLATAYALNHLSQWMTGIIAGFSLLAALLTFSTLRREPWRMVVTDVLAGTNKPSTVFWVDDLSVPAFDYYLRHTGEVGSQADWAPLFGRALPELPSLVPPPKGELWILTVETRYRHLMALLPLDFFQRYELLAERHETGIGAYQFRRRTQIDPEATGMAVPSLADRWGLLLPSPLDLCTPAPGHP